MASGVWAGVTDVAKVHQIADIDDANATVKSELQRIGYLGSTKAHWTATPLAAHFELHIGINSRCLSSHCSMPLTFIHRTRTDSRGFPPAHRRRPGRSSKQVVYHYRDRSREPHGSNQL